MGGEGSTAWALGARDRGEVIPHTRINQNLTQIHVYHLVQVNKRTSDCQLPARGIHVPLFTLDPRGCCIPGSISPTYLESRTEHLSVSESYCKAVALKVSFN